MALRSIEVGICSETLWTPGVRAAEERPVLFRAWGLNVASHADSLPDLGQVT